MQKTQHFRMLTKRTLAIQSILNAKCTDSKKLFHIKLNF